MSRKVQAQIQELHELVKQHNEEHKTVLESTPKVVAKRVAKQTPAQKDAGAVGPKRTRTPRG